MKMYSLTTEELQQFLNQSKEMIDETYLKCGLITREHYHVANKYCVVVVAQKGLFGKMFDKMFFRDTKDGQPIIALLKIPDDECDKEEGKHEA